MRLMVTICFVALVFLATATPFNATASEIKYLAQTFPAPPALCSNPAGLANYYGVPYPARNAPALTTLIQCITTNIPNSAMIDMGQIYTYQQNPDLINYTRGYRDCGLDVTCASLDCHDVFSCHYGGRTGTNGAEAVDFNARAPFTEMDLYNAIHTLVFPGGACANLAKYIELEVDHTHLSTISNIGCDTPNIPTSAGTLPGSSTTNTQAGTQETDYTKTFAHGPLRNPISCEDPSCFLSNSLKIFLGSIGIIGLVLFIYAGFTILTSAGNVERIERGKKTLVYAAIGIVIILISWTLLNFVVNIFV